MAAIPVGNFFTLLLLLLLLLPPMLVLLLLMHVEAAAAAAATACDFDLPSGLTVRRTLIVLLPQWGTTTDFPMDSYMVYTMPTMSSFVILP